MSTAFDPLCILCAAMIVLCWLVVSDYGFTCLI
uniref:Uncharacterized protein n=1 Tax=Arundo donax TaxID=35708 RepID=A0A0A9EGU2_ARUDO